MPTSVEKLDFEGSQGDMLSAALVMPSARPRAYALFAHCFTCSKDFFAPKRIADALAERDIAVLRFDFTGLGHSDGDFANTNFSSNVGDLVAAADWLRQNRQAPDILIGHSLGGAAVLMATQHIAEAKAVVTIGAPSDPDHVRHTFAADAPEIEEKGEAVVDLGGRPFTIRQQFLDDLSGQPMKDAIASLRRALLVCHAPLDQTVGIECAGAIFGAAKHPKSFISLDDADHLISRKEDAVYIAELIAAWSSRYLAAAAEEDAKATEDLAVTVTENGVGPFGQDITTGPHLLHADEPPGVGGKNIGPTPYQLLSAALGACTTMTMRLYANRKKWNLDRASVVVRHDKIHAADCEACETAEGKVDVFEREITLEGALDDEQKQRILEIADKCPVHRTLHGEVQVRTRLIDG
mgnify:CR=1 FL=1